MRREELMALGRFASGVAHEINNPLGSIAITVADLLDLIRARDPAWDPAERDQHLVRSLESIQAEVRRCARIIQHLQELAQIRTRQLEPVDLNPLVSAAIETVSSRARQECKHLRWLPDPLAGTLTTDPHLLRRLLGVVLSNALDAVEAGGMVKVHTRVTEQGIEVEVEDDGCGIAKEHLERVFEPFFTTKPPGKGTGLGLAVGHVIIHRLDGSLCIDSAPGAGTSVRIGLPRRPPSNGSEGRV